MHETLTEKELQFMEFFSDPMVLTENLIPTNFNAPQSWSEEEDCCFFRPYQVVMQDYSYLYANDPELSPKENFQVKIGAGELYSIGARDLGKSWLLIIDALLTMIHKVKEGCIASFDEKHLRNVTRPIASYVEGHPFLQMFHLKNSRKGSVSSDPLRILTEHGALIKGVNEKVGGNEPGVDFHSLHASKFLYEEASYMSEEGTQKRVDSAASYGCIERLSGIPDLRIGSPLTKILQDPKKKPWIWRLPQYVREDWDKDTKAEKVAKYDGQSSAAYRLNVEAEIIEGAWGFWDIERLKKASLREDRRIKYFEVNKDTFHDFENRLIIDRLPGTEQVYIASDIGHSASLSEVIIIFYDGKKYKYHYQISLFNLIQKEQAEVFYWIYHKLGTGFIALDATNMGGEGIIDRLYDMGIPQEHLLKVRLGNNIEVDFEKDSDGNVVYDSNGPIMKKARTIDWAMQELERLMYDGSMEISQDEKFLKEFSGYIVKHIGLKKTFASLTTDHLHQSFQVFAICRFVNQDNPLQNMKTRERSYGVFFNK